MLLWPSLVMVTWVLLSCHWMIGQYLRAKYRDLCKYPNVSSIWGSAIMQTRNYYLWDCSDPRYAGNLRTKSTQYINICNKRQYFPKFNFSCDGGTFPSEVLTSGKEAKILRLFTLGMLVWLRIDQFGIKIFSPNKRNIKSSSIIDGQINPDPWRGEGEGVGVLTTNLTLHTEI